LCVAVAVIFNGAPVKVLVPVTVNVCVPSLVPSVHVMLALPFASVTILALDTERSRAKIG